MQLRNNHSRQLFVQIAPTDTCLGNVFLVFFKNPNTTCLSGRMEGASYAAMAERGGWEIRRKLGHVSGGCQVTRKQTSSSTEKKIANHQLQF